MGDYHDPGNSIVSWRIAASTVHLCDRCRTAYGASRLCNPCLQEANADLREKRGILFPDAHSSADLLSAVALGDAIPTRRTNEKTSIARGLLRALIWDTGR